MRIALFILFFFTSLCLHAQQVSLAYEKQAILLGEPLQVRVEAKLPNGASLQLDTLPHFEIVSQGKVDSTIVSGQLQLAQTLTITSWDSGRWSLPTVITNGQFLKPIYIAVNYTNPWDPHQPYHDIKGIVPIKNTGRSTWWWYVVGAAVLIALFLLFFPKGKTTDAVQLDASAYKKAMDALANLEGKRNTLNQKQFYTGLVDIFRQYLKGAKGIQSFSKTTDDLSIQLQGLRLPQTEFTTLVQVLRLTDLVKFAEYKPAENVSAETVATIRQAITSIHETRAV